MMGDHDDPLVARLWRGIASEAPAPALDAHILAAARAQQRRRRFVPLAAALAACLVLAVYAAQVQPGSEPSAGTALARYPGTGAVLADPDAMEQMMIRQMPGGAASSAFVSP